MERKEIVVIIVVVLKKNGFCVEQYHLVWVTLSLKVRLFLSNTCRPSVTLLRLYFVPLALEIKSPIQHSRPM